MVSRAEGKGTGPSVVTADELNNLISRGELPGPAAHRELAPFGRSVETPPEPADSGAGTSYRAAVLILLYPAGAQSRLHLPLILRTDDGGIHAGQIALPGGRHEGSEDFPTATALRETEEELGIAPQLVRTIGALSPLYVGVSATTVTPVVARTNAEPKINPDPREVADYFSVPLQQFFRRPESGIFTARGHHITAPYFATTAGRVWGATAMMLAELAELFRRRKRATLG